MLVDLLLLLTRLCLLVWLFVYFWLVFICWFCYSFGCLMMTLRCLDFVGGNDFLFIY